MIIPLAALALVAFFGEPEAEPTLDHHMAAAHQRVRMDV